MLAEFGDDPHRYADAKARRNYAGTSPITRQSGKQKFVLARYVHNDRLLDALGRQAFTALTASPAARAYDQLRNRGKDHKGLSTSARQPARRDPPRLPQDQRSTTNTPPGQPLTTSPLDPQRHGVFHMADVSAAGPACLVQARIRCAAHL